MTFRAALLVALAALLLTASLALAAPAANGAAPTAPVTGIAAPQDGATSCGALGFLDLNPAPLPMATDTCGACSVAACAGKPVGATCSATGGVCVSTIACTSNQKTCKCIIP
jgi:hypothetical protein